MILVVSSARDTHTAWVMERLARQGTPARVLDLSRFPGGMRMALGYPSGGSGTWRLLDDEDGPIDLGACRSIWWRRPQPFGLRGDAWPAGHREFALGEWHEAVAGLWLGLDAFWVNHPSRDQEAGRKAFQLRVAPETGLRTPRTLITSDPDAARAFIASQPEGRTIYKAFSATEQLWRETRLLREEERTLLDNVRAAPVIFQEYIPASVDLRVTVVGDDIFAGAVHSQDTDYKVDFRMNLATVRIEAHPLPAGVQAMLHALMRRLGIVYGAIDMRLTPDGEYVFLEVNPAGQWLFVEQQTGQPIAEALVSVLTRAGAPGPPAR